MLKYTSIERIVIEYFHARDLCVAVSMWYTNTIMTLCSMILLLNSTLVHIQIYMIHVLLLLLVLWYTLGRNKRKKRKIDDEEPSQEKDMAIYLNVKKV